jgi:cation diffusion facilitator family transporter
MGYSKTRAASLSIASNSLLIAIKAIAGFLTGSISILAEAIHSLLDLVAAVIAFFGVRVADKPSDKEHPFGHGKAENVSGVIEAILIFVAAAIIIFEAISKLAEGATLEMTEIGIAVMGVSVVANILVSRHLLKVARKTDSIALEADARHLTTDVWTSAGVLVGLIVVRLTGLEALDPIIALAVAAFIIKAAYDILIKSYSGLIDARLPEAEEGMIRKCLEEHGNRLVGFHALKTRKAGSQRFIELHLVMPRDSSVADAHKVCDHLEKDLKGKFGGSLVTIHVEPCSDECPECRVTCEVKPKG